MNNSTKNKLSNVRYFQKNLKNKYIRVPNGSTYKPRIYKSGLYKLGLYTYQGRTYLDHINVDLINLDRNRVLDIHI